MTGVDAAGIAGFGALLAAGGVALVVFGRRRAEVSAES